MQEPHFLREIHERQLKEYKKNKNKSLSERLKTIQHRANKLEKEAVVAAR